MFRPGPFAVAASLIAAVSADAQDRTADIDQIFSWATTKW